MLNVTPIGRAKPEFTLQVAPEPNRTQGSYSPPCSGAALQVKPYDVTLPGLIHFLHLVRCQGNGSGPNNVVECLGVVLGNIKGFSNHPCYWLALVAEVEVYVGEGCMGLGVPVLGHHDDGELGLEKTRVVVAEKVKVRVGDAYHRDSGVDHYVTHENHYACYYNTYGYDCAENRRQPDQRVCVTTMMSVYQSSSMVRVVALVLGRVAMVAVGRRH